MSERDDDARDRPHDPTPRRLEKAREEGRGPQSQDAQVLAAYLGLAVSVAVAGGWAASWLGESLMGFLVDPSGRARLLLGGASEAVPVLMLRIGAPVLALVALPAAFVVALLLAQGSVVAVPSKIAPNFSRLSITSNAKQKYGPKGLFEFAKSVAKVSALSIVLAVVLAGTAEQLPMMTKLGARQMGQILENRFWSVLGGVMAVGLVLAVADLLWQRHVFHRDNRMSHEELKEETKQSEGDPHIRNARRNRAVQIANNRMLNDVPGADVVITNPTHYAVALKWERSRGSAPKCLAKGVDEVALSIRRRAEASGVPVHEDAPTARALYGVVEIGSEIRPEHYRAVAAAIVFADKVRRMHAVQGFGTDTGPEAGK